MSRVNSMLELLHDLQKILPDLMENLTTRLKILQRIEHHQPIGRRALARLLGVTERVLRGEVELLSAQGLIGIQPSGMTLTREGKQMVERFFLVLHHFQGFSEWETVLARLLGLEKVFIVAGDSAQNSDVKKEMGRMAAHYLKNNIKEKDAIAVAGGTSLAAMAEMMYVEHPYPEVTFFPARGGLGESVEIQADTVAARLAEKMGGSYLLLHVPDNLKEETYRSLIEDPHIRDRVEKIRTARLVFHGIGNARSMAERRGAGPEILRLLQERRAIGEAFGYYFDQDGNIVYQMPTAGLRLEDLAEKHCVAVAGGSDKADAIYALAKTGIFQVLITDEGATRKILAQNLENNEIQHGG